MCGHLQILSWELPPPLNPWALAQVPGKDKEQKELVKERVQEK